MPKHFICTLHPDKPDAQIFEVVLMSVGNEPSVVSCGFPITCSTSVSQNPKADIILLSAMVGDLPAILDQNKELINWLKVQHKKGVALVSTCTGSFFLAATGLLNGKEATTSWFSSHQFKTVFPEVILLDEKIIVDNGNIVTGGATLSFTNLRIYLIEKYFGKEMGSYCAKMFLVDKGKSSQQSYAVFTTQKIHQDTEIRQAQEWIEGMPKEKVVVSQIADRLAMSERNFIRRFKAATGNTPSEYIQRIKVEQARQWLEAGKENIKKISYKTGYEDLNHFRGIFKRYTGLTPVEYRKLFVFDLAT